MTIPAAMRGLQQTSLRGPQDLVLVDNLRVPTPGPGEILIRVTAAGINVADLSQAHGTFLGGPQPPYIAGFEGAGEIVQLGEGVEGFELGAHVIGVGYGAFAEYMVLPARAALPLPPGWSDAQALGLVVNLPTAVATLKLGGIAPGQTVLIHAAAGATGQATTRIAKHYGATVIATASPSKHAVVEALGADYVLDSHHADIAAEVSRITGGTGVDLVLETAGGATFEASLASARRITGRVVVSGLPGGNASLSNWDLVYRHQVHIIGFNMGMLIRATPALFGEVMGELFALIAAGVIAPGNPTLYPLADGPSALAALENRTSVGKLGLTP
ncbi:zinc-binding dehydrogenase [Paradevosia shaoguanensis]|uniref:zinc-binding dehydrogenase n=1 Tax=Paradevosia shaoguanensis TaxID=1335043 RepID=UPI001934324C|nr:zinc-binding dehydrogenase [Paradevosia shaoguanensis]